MKTRKMIAVLLIISLLATMLVQPVLASGPGYMGGKSGESVTTSGDSSHKEGDSDSHEAVGSHRGKGQGGKSGSGISKGDHEDRKDNTDEDTQDEEEGSKGKGGDNKGGVNKGGGDKSKGGSGKGGSGKGGSGGKDNSKKEVGGTITLVVTVEWPENVEHPEKVDVILTRDNVDTTLETVDNEVTFQTEASGDCRLTGEAVPGFTVPTEKISLTGNNKEVSATLTYEKAEVSVEGVSLSKENLYLFSTQSVGISAEINPPNANNQVVTWTSEDVGVAKVDGNGLNAEVTAVAPGTTNIKVTTKEGGYTAKCVVTVAQILSIDEPESFTVTALKNEVVSLPRTVNITADKPNPNGQYSFEVPVVWAGAEDYYFQVPLQNPDESYSLNGSIVGTKGTATFIINVNKNAPPAVSVLGVSLDIKTLSLFTGEEYTFTVTYDTDDTEDLKAPTNPELIWASDNNSVATVKDKVVTGVAPGNALITVTTVDGGYTDTCMVSVTLALEPALIFACDKNGDTTEGFETKEDVYINVTNLGITEKTLFYVKVEEKSSNPLLGDGEIHIDDEVTDEEEENLIIIGEGEDKKILFNLNDVTEFEESDSYSSTYFVSMSTDPRYPKDDEKTLKANFKIGSATPTIPDENVIVTAEVINGYRNDNPEGIIFLLCREIGLDAEETNWYDYLNMDKIMDEEVSENSPSDEGEILDKIKDNPYDYTLYFTDEVKRTGTIVNGQVQWKSEGKESLKLGGYLLLEVTPKDYIDNLNEVNPYSEDGSLLKEVHLERDGIVRRNVRNLYVADKNLYAAQTNYDSRVLDNFFQIP